MQGELTKEREARTAEVTALQSTLQAQAQQLEDLRAQVARRQEQSTAAAEQGQGSLASASCLPSRPNVLPCLPCLVCPASRSACPSLFCVPAPCNVPSTHPIRSLLHNPLPFFSLYLILSPFRPTLARDLLEEVESLRRALDAESGEHRRTSLMLQMHVEQLEKLGQLEALARRLSPAAAAPAAPAAAAAAASAALASAETALQSGVWVAASGQHLLALASLAVTVLVCGVAIAQLPVAGASRMLAGRKSASHIV